MKFKWKAHGAYSLASMLSHAHHNGYSILRAKNKQGRFVLGGALYEVMLGENDNDIIRFWNRNDLVAWLEQNK